MHITNRNNKYTKKMQEYGEEVKENVYSDGVLSLWWLAAALAACGGALCAACSVDARLPAPLGRRAPPARFSAALAHDHLVNLTSIGPRVAGSYENEVVAVRVLVEAVKSIAAQASPHNRIDFDVFSASGNFSITFLDGMSNLYRDVQSVVVRARGAGAPPAARPARPAALLLNCHFDTVPDSPGASDDAAGCAVALETLRALVAAPRPLPRPLLLLLNGAEENIMQASHAFVTQHPWAKTVRAFINMEACGAGGREVVFQAGPRARALLAAYAAAAPHPYASSLAQELFQSGLIPADTDFRVFRDFGGLSGLDLAWSADGYVYHTRLDDASRVPPAVLQRTGDNVLATARALLAADDDHDHDGVYDEQPVYFDVLGAFVVTLDARRATLAALVALAAVAAALRRSAGEAARGLHMARRAWAGVVLRAALGAALATAAGGAAALISALTLHACGARLSFYARPWLLLPLYALPAVVGAWADARYTWRVWAARGGPVALARGWWAWRAWRDAHALCAALLLAAGAALRLRSTFLPALWTLPALSAAMPPRAAPAAATALAVLPALQTTYLALGSVHMFAPIMGRAGTAPLPPDALMALLVSQLTLAACSWALPLVVAVRRPAPLLWAGAALAALTAALVLTTPLGEPYSAERPQRVMVFHTRRTVHRSRAQEATPYVPADDADVAHEDFYWIPELDVNTPHSLDAHVAGMRTARATTAADCTRWAYCGAPYFLPVLSLVSRGHSFPAPEPPAVALRVTARLLPAAREGEGGAARTLALNVSAVGAAHAVLVLAAAEGARVVHCTGLGAPQEGPAWGVRRTYFLALHVARRAHARPWLLECRVERTGGAAAAVEAEGGWVQVSAAAHGMAGGRAGLARAHAALVGGLPAHAAGTGWGVDLHIMEL